MSFFETYLGTRPRVLIVGADDSLAVRLESHLVAALDGVIEGRIAVETIDASEVAAALDESVFAVIAVHDPPSVDALSLVERTPGLPPAAPLVLSAPDPDELSISAVFDAGFDDVLARDDVDGIGDRARGLVADEAERRESDIKRRALDAFIDGLDDMAFLKNDAGRYLTYSTEWFGEDSTTVVGRTDETLHDDRMDLGKREYEIDRRVIESGEAVNWEINDYGDELSFYRESTRIPWFDDDGEVDGVVGISRLVTDRVERLQRLEAQNAQLEQFGSFVSHDLRNHINVASGYAELAGQGDESMIDRIQTELDRMDQIVEDIDTLVSDEDGFDTSVDVVDLGVLVTSLWEGLETQDGTLSLAFPDETAVLAAEHKLRPLFENLFKNSIEHGSSADDTDLTVTVGTTSSGFYVEDDGPGLPDQPEQVLEDGYTTTDGNTGTGLSIVSTVAAGHGWGFELADSYDGGARFEFHSVPVVPDPTVVYRAGTPLSLTDETDVGDVRVAGASSHATGSDRWVVSGAGADIWRDENEFHYVYATVDGDARIQCRIADLERVNSHSKAGLMVRDSLAEDAIHQYVGRTAAVGLELLWRDEPAAPTRSYQLEQAGGVSRWVRIDREDDLITCSASPDGVEWTVVGQRRLPLSETVHLGLAVCSVIPRQLCEATFENVSLCRIEPYE